MIVSGEFSVTLGSLDVFHSGSESNRLARMSIDKVLHGALAGESKGEMLNIRTIKNGSAGYVAIEEVSGILNGLSGSFVLQHFGVMADGKDRLCLEVVPDSGTHQLKGLTGSMQIRIEQGQHYYDFDYHLPR
ncbi:hypothetical protein CS022_01460 [Veronia nyctiphanis]|uniref:DUF3224 domain-containing protein n=1 Tax=Veronia nyctiphanis TaxID=1278244 RepID=A0A4Q0YX67_9GAMM|nr:DUF3224 domain-containing protein [Veronia nyctiphanis]RXJ74894.1 hypothetical protein CS022_01460 [Veronia nyctiphanis]